MLDACLLFAGSGFSGSNPHVTSSTSVVALNYVLKNISSKFVVEEKEFAKEALDLLPIYAGKLTIYVVPKEKLLPSLYPVSCLLIFLITSLLWTI